MLLCKQLTDQCFAGSAGLALRNEVHQHWKCEAVVYIHGIHLLAVLTRRRITATCKSMP